MATGHSRLGSNPTSVKTVRFGTSVYPSLSVSFGGDTKSRRSLLSGVYARGSKRSHQSAQECVSITVVDSTSHSASLKHPRSASMRLKTLPCTAEEEEPTYIVKQSSLRGAAIALLRNKLAKSTLLVYIWLKSTKSGPVGLAKIDFSYFSPCSMQWVFQTPGVSIVHVQKTVSYNNINLVFAWSALKVGSFG